MSDRFPRWKIFLIYQVGAVVMVVVYAQLRDPTVMLFTGALMGMFVNGMIGGYGALISDTFPPQARPTPWRAYWRSRFRRRSASR